MCPCTDAPQLSNFVTKFYLCKKKTSHLMIKCDLSSKFALTFEGKEMGFTHNTCLGMVVICGNLFYMECSICLWLNLTFDL